MTTRSATSGITVRPARRSPIGLLRWLPAVTLVAVLTITASAEFELARTVLNLPPHIAWALPVAIDSYVLAALRSRRDVLPALTVMAGALAASMGAHLSADGKAGQPLPGHVVAPAATGIMTVLVVVAWRVHVLIEQPAAPSTGAAAAPSPGTPPDVPGDQAASMGTSTPRVRVTVTDAPPTAPGQSPHSELTRPLARPASSLALPSTHAANATGRDPYGLRDPKTRTTDEAILAAIHGTTPSIRALKRTYGIGQTRATRIHQQITSKAQKSQPESQLTNHEQITGEEATNEISEEAEHQHEERIQITNPKAKSNTHTCITDRVGPSSPTGQASGLAPRPALRPMREA